MFVQPTLSESIAVGAAVGAINPVAGVVTYLAQKVLAGSGRKIVRLPVRGDGHLGRSQGRENDHARTAGRTRVPAAPAPSRSIERSASQHPHCSPSRSSRARWWRQSGGRRPLLIAEAADARRGAGRAARVFSAHRHERRRQGTGARSRRRWADPGLSCAMPATPRRVADRRHGAAGQRRRRQGAQHLAGLRRQGPRVARYDKIHLFGFRKGEERYLRIAKPSKPGEQLGHLRQRLVAGWACRSVTTCAFPRCIARMGVVDLIVLPAAFTVTTGSAHWESPAARARHREPVLRDGAGPGRAPSQRATHLWRHADRRSLGRGAARRAEGAGVVHRGHRPGRIAEVRARLPALQHRQLT